MRFSRSFNTVISALALTLLTACGGSSGRNSGDVTTPRLSTISGQSINANEASMPIAFSVFANPDPSAVQVVASSDNDTLTPADSLVIDGAAGNRTLTVTPIAGQLGTAMITLSATGPTGLMGTSSFTLTVSPQPVQIEAFFRSTFTDAGTAEPRELNSREFVNNAEDDDFEDLLQ